MKILGIDSSFASPGFVHANLNDTTLDIEDMFFLSFTNVKKFEKKTSEYNGVVMYRDRKKLNEVEQYVGYIDILKDEFDIDEKTSLHKISHVAFEDYAFLANGQITKLAETVGTMKMLFYENNIPIRLYNIGNIKRFATGKGNADKFQMEEAFEQIPLNERFDLSFLPSVKEKKAGNPKDNIVDAYFIMKFLQTELKIRRGIITLQDLSEHQRSGFLLVTKSNPVNLPVRPFIQKDNKDE